MLSAPFTEILWLLAVIIIFYYHFVYIFSFSVTFNGSAMTSTESEVMMKHVMNSLVQQPCNLWPVWAYTDRQIRQKEMEADGREGWRVDWVEIRESAPSWSTSKKDCHANFIPFLRPLSVFLPRHKDTLHYLRLVWIINTKLLLFLFCVEQSFSWW